MSDKPMTLEELARAEAEAETKRQATKVAYIEVQKRLATEVPERFFQMARQMRDGVDRFNGAAKLARVMTYSESPPVTTRDASPNGEFLIEVKRHPNWLTLSLQCFQRAGRPDSWLIEGSGVLGVPPMADSFSLRVEGVVRNNDIGWRITSDSRNVDTSLDDLADRLVAVVATAELTRLWTRAPFVAETQ